MKISRQQHSSQRGMAMIVIMALLALMVVYVAANVRSLRTLEREVKVLNQKQERRWEKISAANQGIVVRTNQPSAGQ